MLLSPLPLRAATDATASDPWRLCPPTGEQQDRYSPPQPFPPEQAEETRISAQQVENAAGDLSIFSGDVLIERDQLRMRTDRAIFHRPEQKLELLGNIQIDTQNMGISASDGWVVLKNNSGEFNNTEYFLPESHLRGSAPRVSVTDDNRSLLIDSRFSSCPLDDQSWHLDTGLLELDHDRAEGTAKHAVLWFKGVPVFYSPYISFPLGDQRRSGFLMPSFGSSSSRGFELAVPWYWNIAPNQDAIFTPRYLRKRGPMLGTDYRYLTQASRGELELEYMDNDKLLEQERYLIRYSHIGNLGANTHLDLIANDASDSRYLQDMGSNISVANTTHLERRASLAHYTGPWDMSLMAQSYETIDDAIAITDRPYRRLPQITLRGTDNIFSSDLNWSLSSEWVDFEHESDSREQGQRFDVYPRISWPLQGNAWFITPAVGVRHTQYSITDASNTEIPIEDRNLPISSLDAGLFFERPLNDTTIQTLEPRIFYLNIPYEDQSNIPLFDTGELEFSFSQLFRENRFSGIDRIGDTNQLTLGLSSRLLDQHSGNEYMSISLGQIYYYEDRRVSLDNSVVTDNTSDIVAEISGAIHDWSARANAQWNTETSESDKRSVQLHYQNNDNRIFNLAYRFRRDPIDPLNNLEQTDLSFSWPLSQVYTLMARWNYSLTDKRDIETLFGIEYDACCWAMRLVAQRYLTDDTIEPYDSSIMLQLIFKGLGSVHGKQATNTLKQAILGYQSEY